MNRISLLFYVKKSKSLSNGTAPIYARITVNEMRVELSAKYFIDPTRWNSVSAKVTGSTEEVRTVNAYLKNLEQNIYDAHHQLVQEGKTISAESLKNKLSGKKEPGRSLVDIFEDHNKQVSSLVGKEYAAGPLERYQTTL